MRPGGFIEQTEKQTDWRHGRDHEGSLCKIWSYHSIEAQDYSDSQTSKMKAPRSFETSASFNADIHLEV